MVYKLLKTISSHLKLVQCALDMCNTHLYTEHMYISV